MYWQRALALFSPYPQAALFLPFSLWDEFLISETLFKILLTIMVNYWNSCNKNVRKYAQYICSNVDGRLKCNVFAVKCFFFMTVGTKLTNYIWLNESLLLLHKIYLGKLIGKCVQSRTETNLGFCPDRLCFCHVVQWQWITQLAIHYRPGGPASILPQRSFTTGCQWQSLNNVNCCNQKVIQFKTCFTLLPSQPACRHPLLRLSVTHMYTNQM